MYRCLGRFVYKTEVSGQERRRGVTEVSRLTGTDVVDGTRLDRRTTVTRGRVTGSSRGPQCPRVTRGGVAPTKEHGDQNPGRRSGETLVNDKNEEKKKNRNSSENQKFNRLSFSCLHCKKNFHFRSHLVKIGTTKDRQDQRHPSPKSHRVSYSTPYTHPHSQPGPPVVVN